MKKIGIAIGAVVVLLLVVSFVVKGNNGSDDDDARIVKLERGSLVSKVVETGSLEAMTTVEIKSRVSGRVAELLVDEGDLVDAGQLVAVIDKQEKQFGVEQDRARKRSAEAQLDRLDVEISQRKLTTKTFLARAKSRVDQLKLELNAQPTLTRVDIESAETTYNNSVRSRDLLEKVTHPNQRTSLNSQRLEAESNCDNAQSEYDRSFTLLELGYISQRSFDNAENQHNLANARLNTVEDQIARLDSEQELELGQATETVRQAKAGLDRALTNAFRDTTKRQEYERALADFQDAETSLLDVQVLQASRVQQVAAIEQIDNALNDSLRELGETEIRSPISGIVANRMIQEGELVASLSSFSSGTTILRIEDRSKMIVRLEVNEIDVAKLRVGMAADIDIDAILDVKFSGTITKIAPSDVRAAAQPGQGRGDAVVKYEVEVELDPTQERIKTGMSAKCTMTVLDLDDVLTLPRQYVGKDTDGTYFVMLPVTDKRNRKAKPKRVDVTVGESSDTRWQIINGIEEGDEVQMPEFSGPDRRGMIQFGGDDQASGGDGEPEEE